VEPRGRHKKDVSQLHLTAAAAAAVANFLLAGALPQHLIQNESGFQLQVHCFLVFMKHAGSNPFCFAAVPVAALSCDVPGEAIPKDAFDSDGEVDVAHIFCAKCRRGSSSDDNDLVLCDGPCNRAFHECCLNPRLVAADLPEDEGWLCPSCDAKVGEVLCVCVVQRDSHRHCRCMVLCWQRV
jgi:hypothetical protein